MVFFSQRFRVGWLILLALVIPPAGAFAAKAAEGRLLDRVVARVNNEIITENDLLVTAFGDTRQAETLLPGTSPNVRAVLNSLIDERLMAQAAREEIKEIPEEVIANRVEGLIKDRRSLFRTDQAFLADLDERGWDLESYKGYLHEQEERDYAVQAALARRARAKMTEQDMKSYGEELQRKGESLVHYRLRQILVAWPAKPSETDVKKAEQRMLGILEQVRQGVPFEQLARERSDDKAARATNGDLGWITEKDLQRPILEAVRSLENGQVSQPVRTAKGLHLFQLIRKRGPQELLFEKRLGEARKAWVAELRRRAQIRILLPELAQ